MKKYMTKKRIIWLMIFLCLVQFWRIKDVGGVVKYLPVDSECYQNNSIGNHNGSCEQYFKQKIVDKAVNPDKTCERLYKNETEIFELLKNAEEQEQRIKKILKNRKVFACTGWNGFRTAVFIADENNNLIYYDRDTSVFTNESRPEDFANSYIDEENVSWGGGGDGGADPAPLHPNIFQRIDAKIIQWTAKLFY